MVTLPGFGVWSADTPNGSKISINTKNNIMRDLVILDLLLNKKLSFNQCNNCLGTYALEGVIGGVWAGATRPNTPTFLTNCVTPMFISNETQISCTALRIVAGDS
jgi:hypothetical protein